MTRLFHRTGTSLLALSGFLLFSQALFSSAPPYSGLPPFPSNRALIEAIDAYEVVDVIVLSEGWREGFQAGFAAEVVRGGRSLADLVLTDVGLDFSIALVTRLDSGVDLEIGDSVRIKTFTSQE